MRGSARDHAGYMSDAYADVFREFGVPRALANSGGNILLRQIPGTDMYDAMGCYPIFSCMNWEGLDEDIRDLTSSGVVCISLVTDPFADVCNIYLEQIFDTVIPFKTHYISDLTRPLEEIVSKNRLRTAIKAQNDIKIEIVATPDDYIEDWLILQGELASRHGLKGMKVLSRSAIERLIHVPGAVMLRASFRDVTVGMHIEFVQNDVVYGHLAAYSAKGREIGVSGALHVWEIEYFRDKKRWIDWGGASGVVPGAADTLTSFKQNFSNAQRMTFFCAKVLDRRAYDVLAAAAGAEDTRYFPAYRAGEFV